MRFHQVFNVTQLDTEWVNEKDNGLVFVEQGIGDPDKVGSIVIDFGCEKD